jgi:hypothetical protein
MTSPTMGRTARVAAGQVILSFARSRMSPVRPVFHGLLALLAGGCVVSDKDVTLPDDSPCVGGECETAPDTDETTPPDTDETAPDTDETAPPDTDAFVATIADLGEGDLVITEIMPDSTACLDDDAEWFEARYLGVDPIDLNGLTVSDNGASWALSSSYIVQPGAYVVFWRQPLGDQCYGFTDGVAYGANLALSNGGDIVTLSVNGTVIDTVDFTTWTTVPATSFSLDPARETAAGNDDPAAWCAGADLIPPTTTDRGSPGLANASCGVGPGDTDLDTAYDSAWWDSAWDTAWDTGSVTPPPADTGAAVGDLILSEVCDYGPDYRYRYVELYNADDVGIRLSQYVVQRYSNGGSNPTDIALPDVVLAPGDTFIVAFNGYGDAEWQAQFGVSPDLFSGSINGNGNDTYTLAVLVGGAPVPVDVFGEIGVDGAGTAWEYTDACASRVLDPAVPAPTDAWNAAEWVFTDTPSPGTPGAPSLPPVDTADTADTADTGAAPDTADTADTGGAPPIDTAPPPPPAVLILSEVADPVVYDARFVEITNVTGAPVSTAGFSLGRYSNGATSGTSFALVTVTLGVGESLVVAANSGVFAAEFGFAPGQSSGNINGNGDDVYTLERDGAVVDVYGEIGVDGTATAWEYTDGGARRVPGVSAPNPTFTLAEWDIFRTGGAADFDPGAHTLVAPPADTALPVDTFTPVDSALSGDTFTPPVDTDTLPVDTDTLPVDTDTLPVDTDTLPVDTDTLPADTTPVDTAVDTFTPVDTAALDTSPIVDTSPPVDTGPPPPPPPPPIFLITEVADPLVSNERFVEITNVTGVDTSTEGWSLLRYSNGTTTSSRLVLTPTVVADGDSFVVAYQDAAFQAAFGFAPDQVSGSVNTNGNDGWALAYNDGSVEVIVDWFGELGVDGVGTAWEYTDGGAVRARGVSAPNATFTLAEWVITRGGGTPGTYSPGAHDTSPAPVDTAAPPVDTPIDTPADTPADTQIDTPADTPADTPIDTPADTPVDTPVDTGAPPAPRGPVFLLSEVADTVVSNERYVEIWNAGDQAGSLAGYVLQIYFNGATSPTSKVLDPVTVNAGDVYVIAYNAVNFQTAFGFAPDLAWGSVNANGDDAFALAFNAGAGAVVVDVFGVIGVDGTGQAWEYTDQIAARVGVSSPSATFDLAEWSISTARSPGVAP